MVFKELLSKNRTFKIEGDALGYQCLKSSTDEISWMWHRRYAHLNFRSLNQNEKQNIVKGLSLVSETKGVCDAVVRPNNQGTPSNFMCQQELLSR